MTGASFMLTGYSRLPDSFCVADTQNASRVLSDFNPYEPCHRTPQQFVPDSGQSVSGVRAMVSTMMTSNTIPPSLCARLSARFRALRVTVSVMEPLCQRTRNGLFIFGTNAPVFRVIVVTMKTDNTGPASSCARLRAIGPSLRAMVFVMARVCRKCPAKLCNRLHNLHPGFALKSAAMKRLYPRTAHQVVPFSLQPDCRNCGKSEAYV